MKKQILILTFFVAAILAGTTSAFAQLTAKPYQTVPSAVPSTLIPTPFGSGLCTADELHPVQGQVYTYTVNATPQTDVRWFVVNNNDLAPVTAANDSLLSATGGILPSTDANIDPSDGTGEYIYGDGSTPITGYNINPTADATGQFHTIDIAWKYFDGITDQVLLVAYAEDSIGCTNNLIVYRIIPEPAFTIDIAVLNDAGDSIAGPLDPITGECVSPIESAVYSGSGTTPDGTLTVDYGENWIYYVVNGANYFDSWLPAFQISYDGGHSAIEASWAYASVANDPAATWNTIDVSGAFGTVPVMAGGSGNPGDGNLPAAGGEQIVVRVRIDYGTDYEHDNATELLHFAVDGVAYDGVGSSVTDWYDDAANFGDLHYATCDVDGFTNDKVDYEITPRPEIENAITTAGVDTETKTGDEAN
nr:hypothetical protein [uncultured Draconibacterium sp.]